MVGIKINLLSFLFGSERNCCYFAFKAGRSSNGRTYPSGGYYLGSSPSLPALVGKLAIREGNGGYYFNYLGLPIELVVVS